LCPADVSRTALESFDNETDSSLHRFEKDSGGEGENRLDDFERGSSSSDLKEMELDEMLSSYDDDVLLLKKGQSNLKMSI
jgi:hypothetical protein